MSLKEDRFDDVSRHQGQTDRRTDGLDGWMDIDIESPMSILMSIVLPSLSNKQRYYEPTEYVVVSIFGFDASSFSSSSERAGTSESAKATINAIVLARSTIAAV